MRYRWSIKVGDSMYAGTDANVYLSLAGDIANMREVQISDPDAVNDWEKGDVYHGLLETEELGELQTGTLRHDQSGVGSGWQVDWVKVQNDEDSREWTATVGKWDEGGRFPVLRFTRTNDGQYEQMKKQREKEAKLRADKEAQEKKDRLAAEAKQAQDDEAAAFELELDREAKQLERELKKAKMEADLAKKRAEIERLKNGGQSPSIPPIGGGTGTFRTYELFGILNGMNVPLSQVVTSNPSSGTYSVVPGGRVIVGEQPNEGFGLAGFPGRWQMYYAGRSPAEFGLDPDKGVLGSDGGRGWALNAQFLAQVFGSGWRAAIYS